MIKIWTGGLLLASRSFAKFCALCFLFCSSTTYAQICENVHLPAVISVRDLSDTTFPLREVESFAHRLNRMAGSLKIQKLDIQVKKVSSQYSSFEPIENVLLLGVANSESFSPHLQVIFSHEFGHAIMSQHLKLKYLETLQTISEALKAGQKDKKQRRKIQDVYELSAPYDELFADLTAALLFKNGRIFPESLGPAADLEAPRDFTRLHSFSTWKNAQPDLAPYTNLDPARGALWSWIQKKQIPAEKHSLILESVLEATAKHMEVRLNREENLKKQKEAPTLNQEFLRLVMTELQARGL